VLAQLGWRVHPLVRRNDPVAAAAHGVDLLVIAVPDAAIAVVAATVQPVDSTVVMHVAGSLGLDVLAPHARRAALHPLVSLPDAATGAERLTSGAWFAVAGDSMGAELAGDLGGRCFAVADADRATYHAAAAVASNHLVALMGQVERLATSVGVPAEAYFDLAAGSFANVQARGAAAALTGPVQRGDWATVQRHREALSPSEREIYDALAKAAAQLADQPWPW
jgi:predicted short-subunit dehydrogenase-like oxidoreductase (DUF2520 family)